VEMAEVTNDINKHETRATLVFCLFMGLLFATLVAAPVITYIFNIPHSIKGLEVLAIVSLIGSTALIFGYEKEQSIADELKSKRLARFWKETLALVRK
jgi:hypothetical protein